MKQKEMPPVLKMITVDEPSGKLFLNNYWIIRRVFQQVSVDEFRVWDRELTAWKLHQVTTPLPFSIIFNHTILIQLPGVTPLHGWAAMMAQTYGECMTVDYTRYAGGANPKGKRPAFD